MPSTSFASSFTSPLLQKGLLGWNGFIEWNGFKVLSSKKLLNGLRFNFSFSELFTWHISNFPSFFPKNVTVTGVGHLLNTSFSSFLFLAESTLSTVLGDFSTEFVMMGGKLGGPLTDRVSLSPP